MNALSRCAAIAALSMFGGLAAAPPAPAQALSERKNVDAISPAELAAYKHAIAVLQNDPGPKNYQFFADLHDVFGPNHGCEHGNELFFPWHRSLLYYFERALRATDPAGSSGPSTKTVSIPYWDWTSPPSGSRYPQAFEEAGSPLADDFRNSGPSPTPPFPKSYVFGLVKSTATWPAFAGGPKSSPFYGAIEQPTHNGMHSSYIGGDMGDPGTAANDPIFWSFHAYIDLVWDRWQKVHKIDPTCLNCPLRGLPAEKTAKDLIHVEEQLGYFYTENKGVTVVAAAPTPEGEAPKPRVIPLRQAGIAAAPADHPAPKGCAGKGPFSFRLTVPKEPFRSARLLLAGVKTPTTLSYNGLIYLHPAAEKYQDAPDFLKRYYVGQVSVWVGHGGAHEKGDGPGHGHGPRTALYTDLTRALAPLGKTHAGEPYDVTLVFTAIPVKSRKPAAPPRVTLPDDQEIQIQEVRLILDGSYAPSERELVPETKP